MPHSHVELSKTGFQGFSPLDDHKNLKIHSLNEPPPKDKSHYLLVAIAEVSPGGPVPVQYPGPSVGYVIEGELHVTDKSKPGEVTKLVAGDVIHTDKGSHLTFSSPNKALVFDVSYAPLNINPEDYVVKE